MDKKFISGTVFGLVVGIVVSIATPMLGAKDIVISSPKKQSTSNKLSLISVIVALLAAFFLHCCKS